MTTTARPAGSSRGHGAPSSLHLCAELLAADVLEVPGVEVAGVVDQHVDATEPVDCCLCSGIGGGLVGDVQGHGQQVLVRLDILATNMLAGAVFSELYVQPQRPANFGRFVFLDPRAESFYRNWENAAYQTVALLRSEAGRAPHDGDLSDLVGGLDLHFEAMERTSARADPRRELSRSRVRDRRRLEAAQPLGGDGDVDGFQPHRANPDGLEGSGSATGEYREQLLVPL